jgi:hypothetical protein
LFIFGYDQDTLVIYNQHIAESLAVLWDLVFNVLCCCWHLSLMPRTAIRKNSSDDNDPP